MSVLTFVLFMRCSTTRARIQSGCRARCQTKHFTICTNSWNGFYDQLPKLFPHNQAMPGLYASNPELTEVTARRNSSLQGAYLILAARALGLDCGPLSGFDNSKVDEEFFAAGKPCFGCDQEFFPEGHGRSNFLCNLGYGDPATLFPRLPRLAFNEACSLL